MTGGCWDARVLADTAAEIGECPLYDPLAERVLWVDIAAGLVHEHVLEHAVTRTVELGTPVGFLVPSAGGGFVAGTGRGLLALSADLLVEECIAVPPDLTDGLRINDGACDASGRVIFGTVDPRQQRPGTLWSLDGDSGLTPLADGVAMANGIGFSPAGDRLYFVDTLTQAIAEYRYDMDSGALGDGATLLAVPAAVGLPDGLAVDAEGDIWLALWGAGEIWRLTAAGEHVGTVSVAAAQTSSCAFGLGDRLLITSAREGLAEPLAGRDGALFVAEVGVSGGPARMAAV
jgi:sugar lactone lactonase YvrE